MLLILLTVFTTGQNYAWLAEDSLGGEGGGGVTSGYDDEDTHRRIWPTGSGEVRRI